jgi:hypothetical protein
MAADLVLIDLPGGPYRLDVVTEADGTHWFSAGAMCVCPLDPGGHWHDVAGETDSLSDLLAELVDVYLQGAVP